MADDGMTALSCSRCKGVITRVPVDLTVEGVQLSAFLVRDLMRAVALHCYTCPNRDDLR